VATQIVNENVGPRRGIRSRERARRVRAVMFSTASRQRCEAEKEERNSCETAAGYAATEWRRITALERVSGGEGGEGGGERVVACVEHRPAYVY